MRYKLIISNLFT